MASALLGKSIKRCLDKTLNQDAKTLNQDAKTLNQDVKTLNQDATTTRESQMHPLI